MMDILNNHVQSNTSDDKSCMSMKSPINRPISPNFHESLEIYPDGRESLGILPPNFDSEPNFFTFTDRDSLSFKNILLEDSDPGRESLGILQINDLDVNFGNDTDKIPDIKLSFIDKVNQAHQVLDTGFLITSPSKLLISATSPNSVLSFNSNSLEFPSKIFTLTRTDFSSSVFSSSKSLFNNAHIINSCDVEQRNRINSQPLPAKTTQAEVAFWSTRRPINKRASDIFCCEQLKFDDDKDDMFQDSVFIEGNHIAQKLADGSFLNEHYENGPLDSTPQPEWPTDMDDSETRNEENDHKVDTGTVFKTIDKLVPSRKSQSESNAKSSSSSSSSTRSREAKEMLQNLSDIFNTTHKSDKMKLEGRKLLSSLAELLNNTQSSKDEEDSGHSSIIDNDSDKEKPDMADGIEPTQISEQPQTMEPTLKPEVKTASQLSQSTSLDKKEQKLERRNSSTSSVNLTTSNKPRTNSNSVKSAPNIGPSFGTKFKPKIGNPGLKTGPLRAVIPVKDMKKRHSTPDRIEQKTLQIQSKRTSTPINEPRIKPMASSTPTLGNTDNHTNSSPKWMAHKSKLIRSNSLNDKVIKNGRDLSGTPNTSKLRRPSFSSSPVSSKEKTNTSSSVSSRFQEQYKITRRNSMTEGVVPQFKQKRSNSLGKETGIMSSLRKVRENLLKSPYYDQKAGILVDGNNKIETDVEKKVTFKKSLNNSMKLKKSNKENAL
ncbi:unnamed protein product [Diabrotica balteata]|uniref:Uncharacterized protein n=1 Tax=Diabrotica balteata TaxID=107213 RepID=A0A9N9SUY1_DIABA|nr:unnamed protein product [Diabrotica balteata]